MEIKISFAEVVKHMLTYEKDTVKALQEGTGSIHDGMTQPTYDLIRDYSNTIVLRASEVIALISNDRYPYTSNEDLTYLLVLDYLEYYFYDKNRYKTFAAFKKAMIRKAREA